MTTTHTGTFAPMSQDSDYELDDEPEYGRSSILFVMGFIIIAAFFVGVIYFAYEQGLQRGRKESPPLIVAQPGDVKVDPSTVEEGSEPYLDSFTLSEEADQGAVQIVEAPEEPIARDPAGGSGLAAQETGNPGTETIDVAGVPSPNPDIVATSDQNASDSAIEVPDPATVMADAEEASSSEAEPSNALDIGDLAAAASSGEGEGTSAGGRTETASLDPATAGQEEVSSDAIVGFEETQEPEEVAKAVDPSSGSHVVQILSSPKQSDADDSRSRFERQFTDTLIDLAVETKRADLGAKGIYYRVRIGPFTSARDAASYCTTIKSRGQDCFVAKP